MFDLGFPMHSLVFSLVTKNRELLKIGIFRGNVIFATALKDIYATIIIRDKGIIYPYQ